MGVKIKDLVEFLSTLEQTAEFAINFQGSDDSTDWTTFDNIDKLKQRMLYSKRNHLCDDTKCEELYCISDY